MAEVFTGRMLNPGVADPLRGFSTQHYPKGLCHKEESLARRDLDPSFTSYWLLGLAKTGNSSMPQFFYLVMRLVPRWAVYLGVSSWAMLLLASLLGASVT